LTEQGRATTAKVAAYLAGPASGLLDPPISEIRHSGKRRAHQTAEVFGEALGGGAPLTVSDDMNPKDDPGTIHDELAVKRNAPGALMLVGHLPYLAKLSGLMLTRDANDTPIRFVNSAVLKISPSETGWVVDWYLTPACVP
jgi:phosphohistidine phosphatase